MNPIENKKEGSRAEIYDSTVFMLFYYLDNLKE